MSTKKIYEALLSHGVTHDASEALAELEAIRKAAKDLTVGKNGRGWEQPGVHEAFEVMELIAKENTHGG